MTQFRLRTLEAIRQRLKDRNDDVEPTNDEVQAECKRIRLARRKRNRRRSRNVTKHDRHAMMCAAA